MCNHPFIWFYNYNCQLFNRCNDDTSRLRYAWSLGNASCYLTTWCRYDCSTRCSRWCNYGRKWCAMTNLGFNEAAVAFMIALYVAQDSFGTATNVTGDGAVAAVIDAYEQKLNKNQVDSE